jgi:hypothetical protein
VFTRTVVPVGEKIGVVQAPSNWALSQLHVCTSNCILLIFHD